MPPRQTTTGPPGTSLANMSQWCRSLTAGSVPDETAVGLQDLYAQVVVHVMAELVERREARTVVATQPAQAGQKRRQPSMQQDLNDVLQQQLGMDYWPRALALWQQEQQQEQAPPHDHNDHASPSLPSLPRPRKKSKKARQREAAANPQLVAEQERLLAASRTKALSSAAPDRTKEKDDTV
jgi:hypothetical protein